MNILGKSILIALGSLIGLAILIAGAAALYLTVNAKARVEAAASEALGMDVKVVGRSTIGILPGLHLTLEDVHVRQRDADVGSAAEVALAIDLLPLLHHELQVEKIGLKGLRIAIERNRDGKLNVGASSGGARTVPALTIAKVSASNLNILYADRLTGTRLEVSDCTLSVDRLWLPGGDSSDLLKGLSFAAKLACGQLRTSDFSASDVTLTLDGKEGIFSADPLVMRLLGGLGSGSVRADYSGDVPVYHVHGRVTQFSVEEFFKALSPKNVGTGLMDFSADLIMRGPAAGAVVKTVEGEASLRGKNLILDMGDLDREFSRYESSQNFNLVDVGAVFFAGPLGLVVTKGYNFARIFQGSGGSTTVVTLVSEWQVERGVAHARDVAMATPKNRVALKGSLDFVTGRFDDVTVALIDAKGCPQVQQKVRGQFLNPQVEPPSVLKSITGPTRRLLAQVKGLLGAKCDVFYAGVVAPPT